MRTPHALALAAVLAVSACTSTATGETSAPPSSPSGAVTSTSTSSSVSVPPVSTPASSSTPPPTSLSTSAAPASPSSSASSGPATARAIARPVTSSGAAVPGWRVRNSPTSISCAPAEPSPAATDPGIGFCSPSAAYAIACWRSDAAHALCALDLAKRVLIRYRLDGSFAASAAPERPAPFQLSLEDGATCRLRDGGTGNALPGHPDWDQFYFCDDHTSVFGPPDGNGVNTADPLWTVVVASDDGAGEASAVPVRSASFVGTARG